MGVGKRELYMVFHLIDMYREIPNLSSLTFILSFYWWSVAFLLLQNMTLHYLSDGSIMTSINYRKEIFFVPLIFILKVNQYKIIIIIIPLAKE